MKHLFSVVLVTCAVIALTNADFRTDSLALHNQYRAKHHSRAMVLNNTINNYAQNWAQNMLKDGFQHSKGKYGENIFWSSNSKLSDKAATQQAITEWYNEGSIYNYNTQTVSSSSGHFTQIVWKNSKYLGIGVARSSKGVYVCSNYDPPGNVIGQYPQNVLKP